MVMFTQQLGQAQAQAAPGNNAVFNSSGGVTFSAAWIDASGYWTTGIPDFCGIINGILTQSSYPASGAVIDARGLVYPGGSQQGQTLRCTVSDPFQAVSKPSTILLPAATIPVLATWTLPNNTKIIGEGAGTILLADSSLRPGYMIEMGSSSSCPQEGCSGVGVEHVFLDATNNSGVNGIHNQFSQTPSYVNDVNFFDFSLTGLRIEGPSAGAPGAIDSGPYTNISYHAISGATCGSRSPCPICVDVEAQTRGLHGVTCVGNANTNQAGVPGITVNASNNSVEDIHVESFWDGIEVGDTTNAVSNVLVANVTGSTARITNAVHICGTHPSSSFGACQFSGSLSDVTVLNVSLAKNVMVATSTTTVQDDVTTTSIVRPSCTSACTPTTTAKYVLGEGLGLGFSRFATTPSATNSSTGSTAVPTWGVGSSSVANQACQTPGALYSKVTGGTNGAVLVCTTALTWKTIP
jgi:hypothetical protein